MYKKRQNLLEDLIVIAARLQWKYGLLLALASYFGFHLLAGLSGPSIQDMSPLGGSIGSSVFLQMIIVFGQFLQYLVPVAFMIGAGISCFRERRTRRLKIDASSASCVSEVSSSAGSAAIKGPACPKCGSPMSMQVAKRGARAGNSF